jgi:CheY-like chemotaxis protein
VVTAAARKTILVIDDESVSREALQMYLTYQGYGVTAVGSARRGLELLEEGLVPCLIVLDLMMHEMDGFAFRERQRQLPAAAAIPVVVCSGYDTTPTDRDRLGAEMYLRKPIDLGALMTVLHARCGPSRQP